MHWNTDTCDEYLLRVIIFLWLKVFLTIGKKNKSKCSQQHRFMPRIAERMKNDLTPHLFCPQAWQRCRLFWIQPQRRSGRWQPSMWGTWKMRERMRLTAPCSRIWRTRRRGGWSWTVSRTKSKTLWIRYCGNWHASCWLHRHRVEWPSGTVVYKASAEQLY